MLPCCVLVWPAGDLVLKQGVLYSESFGESAYRACTRVGHAPPLCDPQRVMIVQAMLGSPGRPILLAWKAATRMLENAK